MVTGKQLAEEAMKVYNLVPQAGYIWGTAGILWTEARQKNLVNKYNSDPSRYSDYKLGAKIGKKWIGHIVYDCSGLTSKTAARLGLSFHHGSNSSYRYDCAYKGVKTSGMKLPVGAWVYTGDASKHGHIGVVVDGEWVVEAMGTNKGVVKSRISDKKWTYWGLAKGVEFDFIPGQETPKTTTDASKETVKIVYPTLRRGARGDLVAQLQTFLSKDGSSLAIDGIFGPGTQSAVRSFQKRHGLVVDGIVGPKTWAELLKLV